MNKALDQMSIDELLEEEKDAWLNHSEAFQFNEDQISRAIMGHLDRITMQLEMLGVCRGGLNDGCAICQAAQEQS